MTSVFESQKISVWDAGKAIVRVGVLGPISEIDPRKAVDYLSALILGQVFDTPYEPVAGQTTTKPVLFEPLRPEGAQGLEYSAAIRPGITFSDGTPLTADIAARSLHAAPALARKVVIDVRGDRVWFTLAARNPRFDLTLTQSSCAIVLDKGLQLHGTGPFMFDHRPNIRLLQSASRLRLVRNPAYQGRTRLEAVEFHVLKPEADGTPKALLEAMRDGSIDVTTALSAADLASANLPGVVPITKPANSTALLFMNVEHSLLRNIPARRCIAAAVDLFEIAALSHGRNPAAYVAAGTLPPSMARSMGTPATNRTEAARLAGESGLRGTRLKLLIPWGPRPYLPKPLASAQVIEKQLGEIGITLAIAEPKTSDEYFDALSRGRFDLALGGWIADTPDPADFYEALLWSRAIGSETQSNYSRWQSGVTDAALERFRAEPQDAQRREIDRIIREEVPFLPLIYGQSCALHARRLRDVTITPNGLLALAEAAIT